MLKDIKNVFPVFLLNLLKIAIAGVVIGYFHRQENFLVVILALKIIHQLYKQNRDKIINLKVQIAGILITGVLGVIIEYLGTTFNYWEYHNISGQLPRYLILVWMLAFTFMYKVERLSFLKIKDLTIKKKIIISILTVLIFPTVGEIICINFGVWTYYYPYIFLGVSPYTIVYIAIVHIIINYIMYRYLIKHNIKDVVLNP